MDAIQKIECKNNAWFVMSFTITDGSFSTPSSGNFPISQSRTIDLSSTKLAEGTEVWINVSPVGASAKDGSEKFAFAMNGKTALYEVTGTLFGYSITFKGIEDDPNVRPPGFPVYIPILQEQFINWDLTINVPNVWTCQPRTASDVVDACNWAAQNGYTVRPKGVAHNWSPLAVTPDLPSYNNLLLIDTTVSLIDMTFNPASGSTGPSVTVGTGQSMGELLVFMEAQAGGQGAASGYSFPHVPAPNSLTVGGVLAINGHGTAVPTPPNDDFRTTYGSMSNRILSLTAVVTDPDGPNPGSYALKTFKRGDKETTAFMTQLGRAMITEVTLQVIDNYNMRCLSYTDIDATTLFAPQTGPNSPAQSCGDFLNQSGRVEAIWYPFTQFPWLKVWTVEATKPKGSREVDQPNNYWFSDNLPEFVTPMIDAILNTDPSLTVKFGQMMQDFTISGLNGIYVDKIPIIKQTRDIWGASKNTLFYVKDTTLRVTANGYAVLMKKAGVQQAISDFTAKFEALLNYYKDQLKQYPINSPVEIRVTGLDSGDDMPSLTGGPAGRPVISSLATDADTENNGWDVAVWFDVLSLPGTKYSENFYTDLEKWLVEHFTAPGARVLAEWSKGWAYTPAGPWTDQSFIDRLKVDFTTSRDADDNWAWETATLAKYDASNIYQSKLTQTLLP